MNRIERQGDRITELELKVNQITCEHKYWLSVNKPTEHSDAFCMLNCVKCGHLKQITRTEAIKFLKRRK